MPNYTPNLNLKKPLPNENYNVEDFNGNAEIIDQAITEQAGALAAHLAETATGAHKAKNISIDDAQGLFNATHVEGALEELFTSVSDGKNLIAAAITDKGGTASGSDTFAQLATKITAIPSNAVRSIQRGYHTGSSSDITIPLSTINPEKSIVLIDIGALREGDGSYNNLPCLLSLTNNSMTVSRSHGGNYNLPFSWQVIEYEDVKSIQRGVCYISETSSDITISLNNVDPNKCIAIIDWGYNRETSGATIYYPCVKDITPTSLVLSPNNQFYDGKPFSWQVIEFH